MTKHEAAELMDRIIREITELRAKLAVVDVEEVAADLILERALERVQRDLTAANESLLEALDYGKPLDYPMPRMKGQET